MKHEVVKAGGWFVFWLFTVTAFADVAPAEQASAEQDLEFASELNNKCQKLDMRGKLWIVRNAHKSKSIKYRLVRYFAGKPQPGLTTGVVKPGGKARPIGCTLVDGHEQTWKLRSAHYVD